MLVIGDQRDMDGNMLKKNKIIKNAEGQRERRRGECAEVLTKGHDLKDGVEKMEINVLN